MKIRKIPVVVDGEQWTGQNQAVIEAFVGNYLDSNEGILYIPTLEGRMEASAGDWIIRGVKGEFYPCKPDIFAETYEVL